jgi:hypothetical protein
MTKKPTEEELKAAVIRANAAAIHREAEDKFYAKTARPLSFTSLNSPRSKPGRKA